MSQYTKFLKLIFLWEIVIIDINYVSKHGVQCLTHAKEGFSIPFHQYRTMADMNSLMRRKKLSTDEDFLQREKALSAGE